MAELYAAQDAAGAEHADADDEYGDGPIPTEASIDLTRLHTVFEHVFGYGRAQRLVVGVCGGVRFVVCLVDSLTRTRSL